MSKKVISLAAIWLLLSTLVHAQGQPPTGPTRGDAPAQLKTQNVESLGYWPTEDHYVFDLSVYEKDVYVAGKWTGAGNNTGLLTVIDVRDPGNANRKGNALDAAEHPQESFLHPAFKSVAVDHHVWTVIYDLYEETAFDGIVAGYYKEDVAWGWRLGCHHEPQLGSRVVEMWIIKDQPFKEQQPLVALSQGLVQYPVQQLVGGDCSPIATYRVEGKTVSSAAYDARDVEYAYLGTADGQLIVVDIGEPVKQGFKKVGSLDVFPGTIRWPRGMAAVPGYVYMALDDLIAIIDVSNPYEPKTLKTLHNATYVRQMAVAGDFLHVAGYGGVEVYDVLIPREPRLEGHYRYDDQLSGRGYFGNALFVVDNLIYTGGREGMRILRFTRGATSEKTILYTAEGSLKVNGESISASCSAEPLALGGGQLSSLAECELREGDSISFDSPDARLNLYASCTDAAHPMLFGATQAAGERGAASMQMERIQTAAICGRLPSSATGGAATPELAIAHESGALRYSFEMAGLPVEVKTGTATVQSTGANEFGVARDAASGATEVSCHRGSVGVKPTNASLAPVTLQGGQQVEVTSENVGPVTEFREPVYLPLVVRNTKAGPTGGWRTLLREGFEGAFPGAWSLADGGAGVGEHHWGSRTCRPHAGGRSAWAVGGGADGAALACGSNYPGSVESWMWAGPFDLSDATAAEVRFQRWLSTDSSDWLLWFASADGVTYQGWQDSGSAGGWQETVFDLANVPGLGDLTGDRDVWIAFAFSSDASGSLAEGAYVDDIHLRKYVPAAGVAGPVPVLGAGRAGAQGTEGLSPVRWVRPGAAP